MSARRVSAHSQRILLRMRRVSNEYPAVPVLKFGLLNYPHPIGLKSATGKKRSSYIRLKHSILTYGSTTIGLSVSLIARFSKQKAIKTRDNTIRSKL